jgi:hypothetical protein
MKLGGWTRIWVVLVVLYAALVTFVAYSIRPTLDQTYQQWFGSASGAIAAAISKQEDTLVTQFDVQERLLGKSRQESVAWLRQVAKSPTQAQRAFSVQVGRINAEYGNKVAAFPEQERLFWLKALGWWLVGAALLYLLGWSVGWVARGFRTSAP